MFAHSLLAVQSVSDGTFQLYRVAILLSGVLLAALAAWGAGATVLARVFSAAVGLILVGYALWLWLGTKEGQLYAVYPWLFILPALVIGYHFYTRALNREIDASVREQLEAERAARRAARSEEPRE